MCIVVAEVDPEFKERAKDCPDLPPLHSLLVISPGTVWSANRPGAPTKAGARAKSPPQPPLDVVNLLAILGPTVDGSSH